MRTLITLAALLSVFTVQFSSASTSGAGLDDVSLSKNPTDVQQQVKHILTAYIQEFESDLESIKIQFQNERQQSDLRHQMEIASLRSELQVEQTERVKMISELNVLKDKFEGLQVRLKSVSEENHALKTELLSFFQKMSNSKKLDSPIKESGSQEVVQELQKSTKMDSENLNHKDQFNGEDININAKDSHSHVFLSISSTGGVSYIRWGRNTCEGDANILYTGYAAQKRKHSADGTLPGSGYICLHSIPQWGGYASVLKDYTTVSGVEYGMLGDDPFSTENNGGQALTYNDVPCTMCQVDTRSNQLMIPGRKSCPSGWTLEYWGYLVTSYYSVDGSPYLCLDQAPEVVPGGTGNAGVAGIYTVEAYCLGLLCPPYFQGYEITCAVCSK